MEKQRAIVYIRINADKRHSDFQEKSNSFPVLGKRDAWDRETFRKYEEMTGASVNSPRWQLAHEDGHQHEAIKAHIDDLGYDYFYTTGDVQTYDADDETAFECLKKAFGYCEKVGAILFYAELGPIYQHPVFFSLIKAAKKRGIKIQAVRNKKVLEYAQRHLRIAKKITKKGSRKIRRTAEEKKLVNNQRDPILLWKEKNKVPTKRFKNYQHLYMGTDPVYKYFLRPNKNDPLHEDTESWEPINAYDADIGENLHYKRHLTIDGFFWTKESVRKARHIIHSDIFKEFCEEKNRLAKEWEEGVGAKDAFNDKK